MGGPFEKEDGKSVTDAFQRILKGSKGGQPLRLQTDLGKEFYNQTFEKFLKDKSSEHFSTHGDSKAAVVERWDCTLKERMYRMFTALNTLTFYDRLPLLVWGYNTTPPRSIGLAPHRVTRANERTVLDRLYERRLRRRKPPRLKVGDRVCLNKKYRPFQKGYLPGWTEKVFFVRRVRRGPVPTYKIKEWDSTPMEGTFYQEDIQKVAPKYDSWIPKRHLKAL